MKVRFLDLKRGALLLGIQPEKTVTEKDVCTSTITAALFTVARTGKRPRHPSTDE